MIDEPLLRVERLSVGFNTEAGPVQVTTDVSFDVPRGAAIGLVGESGCGKSVTAQTIMRLLPSPPSRILGGRVLLEGVDLLALSERQMQKVRGERIGMIFQEPMTSLNPTMRVEDQIVEVLRLHRGLALKEARPMAADILRKVGIGNPERRLRQYPHELSGGLRQRVMIAIAIVCSPRLLIADEPTTALDVTIQAQILDLLRFLQKTMDLSILLITHDLDVVAEMCSEVIVMYAGAVVERGTAEAVLTRPRHPYTAGLLAASPRRARKGDRLITIPGAVPPPGVALAGCRFAQRCSRALPQCRTLAPAIASIASAHQVACWNPCP
ncbi:MAG TPA: ABC transporter ATP-binding protein [Burkholderiales bacterium]|nr:ABC transporter ATP-binding protein [Burkholderiales bacterium]